MPAILQVFVADEDIPQRSMPQALGTSDDVIDVQAMTLDPWQQGAAKLDEGSTSPLWWSPPPNIYVEPRYREQVRKGCALRMQMCNSRLPIDKQAHMLRCLFGCMYRKISDPLVCPG